MTGSAIKCDECGKVDVHEEPNGMNQSYYYKWFRIRSPQHVNPNQLAEKIDICSSKCLQAYIERWTTSA